MHWYRGLRSDYFDQLTAEIKAPARNVAAGRDRMKKIWQKKAGKRNEFLDCNVYALHAARALRIDLYTSVHWASLRERFLQGHLFAPEQEPIAAADALPVAESSTPAAPEAEQIVQPVPQSVPSPAIAARAMQNTQQPSRARRMRSAGVTL